MIYIFMGILLTPVVVLGFLSFTAKPPHNIGPNNGRLSDCPKSPNCVCSQASDDLHFIEAIVIPENCEEPLKRMREIVSKMPGATVVDQRPNYLYAVFRSRIFRFPDDVEFLLDDAAGVIQVRSASRVGKSDLGVNRSRVEQIRARFHHANLN